jgi:ethanolamine-phosphate cytidylyltransferase
VPISEDRLWVDGCFDFSHHGKSKVLPLIQSLKADRSQSTGHAGAMLQARQLGKELYVGIHSDQAILENKGPTVMSLEERSVCLVLFRTLVYS